MTLPFSQIKVLVADRAPSVADVIARSLKSQGYAIAGIVSSGEKALEFATITVPDIVLMELPLLGQMDGLTAAWKIYSELYCPVVYMTASSDRGLMQRAELTNPYGFLSKPFTASQLTQCIEQALQRYRLERNPGTDGNKSIAVDCDRDSKFLSILSTASKIQPMPQLFFEGGVLRIYTSTTESAKTLSDLCFMQELAYPYQTYTWSWKLGQYKPFD